MNNDPAPTIRRREALIAFGAGIGALTGLKTLSELTTATPETLAASGCVLQREVTEGPYYLDLDLVRRNIRRGRKGTPLTLRFVVVDASTCKPIHGAKVEVWHADASGTYSGVAGVGGNYLRGVQVADSAGRVRFESIFPGWYRGRTPHIHMKVFVSGNEVHTGQVFFRQAVQRTIYRQGAYASRGQADTTNRSDNIYREAGARALMTLKRKGSRVATGYNGRLTVGVEV
jgi:protocatechuate 3,4-dioxygenase beta subunit